MIISDDTGFGDLGPYGGGVGRGMPTPNIDRLAAEGMTFFSFYAQPSCTPGRAAMQTGRIPEPQRHDHRGLPGPGRRPAGGGMDAGLGAQDRRLQDLLHRQMASRRSRLRVAERAGLRRDEILRPLSSQRLHLRRSDLVPGHAGGSARDVPARDQGLAVGQCRAAGARRTSRSTANMSTRRSSTARKAWSAFRSSTAMSKRRRSTISTAMPIRASRSS